MCTSCFFACDYLSKGWVFSLQCCCVQDIILGHNISDLLLDHWGDKIMAECPRGT